MKRVEVAIIVAALALGGAVVLARWLTSSASAPAVAADPSDAPTVAAPTQASVAERPNDGWFVGPLPGAQMKADEVVDDPDLFPLYFDDGEAAVFERVGVDLVRVRSYFSEPSGGGVITIVPAARPRAVLRGLDGVDGGLGRPFPGFAEGRIRRHTVQMESTRAHDVFAHFCTISFVEGRYAVVVEAYGSGVGLGRRRALHYARAQRELLAARG